MKITDIDTIMIDSPGRKWTIVRVFTDEGLVGLGEPTYSNKEPIVCAAVDNMQLALVGEDPARIENLWHKLFYESSVSGIWRMVGQVWMSALSGIDQALWGISRAKSPGCPWSICSVVATAMRWRSTPTSAMPHPRRRRRPKKKCRGFHGAEERPRHQQPQRSVPGSLWAGCITEEDGQDLRRRARSDGPGGQAPHRLPRALCGGGRGAPGACPGAV